MVCRGHCMSSFTFTVWGDLASYSLLVCKHLQTQGVKKSNKNCFASVECGCGGRRQIWRSWSVDPGHVFSHMCSYYIYSCIYVLNSVFLRFIPCLLWAPDLCSCTADWSEPDLSGIISFMDECIELRSYLLVTLGSAPCHQPRGAGQMYFVLFTIMNEKRPARAESALNPKGPSNQTITPAEQRAGGPLPQQ